MWLLVFAYLTYGAIMVWLHPRFIYPFDPQGFSDPSYAIAEVSVPETDPLPVLVHQGDPDAPVVVYFMGNVGALERFRSILDFHRDSGVSLVAMSYRGGGTVPGTPSETRLKADAVAVIDALPELVSSGPVLVHGYSLGSGLALHVAAERPVTGVLLSAPYDRMCTLMSRRAYLPACLLPGVQGWKSADALDGISAPVTILHGADDTLIPPKRSAALAEALRAADLTVTRNLVPGVGHNDLMQSTAYTDAITAFVDAYR